MQGYKEYKETGLAWLGKIPSHWQWLYLSQVTSEQKIKNSQNTEENVLSLSYGNIIRKENKFFGLVPKEYETYQIVSNGNIILRLTDLQNDKRSLRTGLVKETGIITSAYTCLKPKENSAYLHYVLHSFDTQKVFYGLGGGVRQSVGYAEIRNICVPLPPQEEQDKIVQFLDHKLEKIHKFIANKQKLIALLEEQKQAIINQAVTKGLDLNAPMKHSGIDWLGEVPKHWEVEKLKRFCKVNASISHLIKDIQGDEPLVFLPMEKVSTDGVIDCSERRPFKSVKSGFSSFAKSDVVVAKITPCFENGKGAYLDKLETKVGYGTTEFITLRPNEKILGSYLYLITSCKSFRLQGEDKMTGSAGQKRVPSDFIAQFTLGIPDVKEQEMIINFVNVQTKKIKSVMDKTQKEIDLIQEYKTSLISSVVTGQVDICNIII